MLSLIIPCFNEEENVESFYTQTVRTFDGKIDDYEFIFIDDGSQDMTYRKLRDIYNSHPESNIKVLSFSRNFGKEAAVYAGLCEAKGDLLCIIDADLQQRPETVLTMLEEMQSDPSVDCVTAYQKRRQEGAFLRFVKSAFYKIINIMSEVDFVNAASDFRLFNRKMADAILSMTEYHRFSKGLFGWVGFNTKFIPYTPDKRGGGKTKWSFKSLIKYAFGGIFAFSTAPLKLSAYIGFFTSIASIVYLFAVVLQKLFFGIEIPGYATIVVLLLLIGGIQLFCLGIVGEYLSKMYVQVKNRPIYILRDKLSHKEEPQNGASER